MRAALAITALVFTAVPAAAEEKSELVIYTYESFVSEWGPGPQIAANFEKECGCTVRFVGAGDGAALLGRLRLEGERTPADIVLGLDTMIRTTIGSAQYSNITVVVVDQNAATAGMSADGVHPTQAGYNAMAAAWMTAITPFLDVP